MRETLENLGISEQTISEVVEKEKKTVQEWYEKEWWDKIYNLEEIENELEFELNKTNQRVMRLNEQTRPTKLKKAREIQEWFRKNDNKPRLYSLDKEEKRLAYAMRYINRMLIKQYNELTTEEREQYLKEKPETKEIIEIMDSLADKMMPKRLKNAIGIQEWFEKNGKTRLPTITSKDEIESKLGHKLNKIRQRIIKPYNELATEEDRQRYKETHPVEAEIIQIINGMEEKIIPTNLKAALEIQEWFKKNGETRWPSKETKNIEERKLGEKLHYIKDQVIKKYVALTTEEEKEEYRKKFPEIDEVLEIVNNISKKIVPVKLRNAREIQDWFEKNGEKKLPSTISKDEVERALCRKLNHLKRTVIKPYDNLKTEDEKEQYREKYPETEEVMSIIANIELKIKQEKESNNKKRLSKKTTQALGKETIDEQNDTQYINETEHAMELHEKNIKKAKIHND